MRLSEVSVEDFRSFGNIPEDVSERDLKMMMEGALAYISSYTGRTPDELDVLEDLTIPYLVLCTEMYDNRDYTVQADKVNPFVQSVLSLHSVNLI